MKISQYTDNELKCAYAFYKCAIKEIFEVCPYNKDDLDCAICPIQRFCGDTLAILSKIITEKENRFFEYGKELTK